MNGGGSSFMGGQMYLWIILFVIVVVAMGWSFNKYGRRK